MFRIALFEPEIPPNTGNIIRLAANIGAELHLIEPLGFSLDDKKLRRAGLDYHEFSSVQTHASWHACQEQLGSPPDIRFFACSTRGKMRYDKINYQSGDVLLFGPETRGLPAQLLESLPEEQRIRLPMQPQSRSLNLSNAVSVIAYEAWRQLGSSGAD